MQVTDIDAKIDIAIHYLEMAIDKVEREANNTELFPVKVSLSHQPMNYEKATFELYELIQTLRNIKTVHRIYKISDEMKDILFRSYLNNESAQSILITEPYTVKECDTFELIANKFNIDWKIIAKFNNIDSMLLVTGQEILIPKEVNLRHIIEFNATLNPVFDLPSGERILGKDLPNALEEDANSDLKLLRYRETFLQGMKNLANTSEGAMPFYSNFGINAWIGDDIPKEISGQWQKQKIQNSFLKDSRVSEVPLDEIEIDKEGEGSWIIANVYPINGIDFEKITAETKFI